MTKGEAIRIVERYVDKALRNDDTSVPVSAINMVLAALKKASRDAK